MTSGTLIRRTPITRSDTNPSEPNRKATANSLSPNCSHRHISASTTQDGVFTGAIITTALQAGMSSILPRTSDARYKRVDTMDKEGAGPRGSRVRFGWKKFAVGAAVIIGLVWLFGPRERRENVLGRIKSPNWSWSGGDDEFIPSSHPAKGPPSKQPPKTTKPPSLPTSPHSPDDDPDPLKTVHCLRPFRNDMRLVQYALMIDAGSTGSRIHIYKFNNCGQSPAYEYEVFKQRKPGLSNYATNPVEAAESLDELLNEAVSVVPESLHSCTPVAVKATAGLRLLGTQQSEAILTAVQKRLHDRYPFAVVENDGVVIMDGKDEGVYAWITANYLLNTISADSPVNIKSYAVLDLGGASTQIVFEPDFDRKPDSAFIEGEHKYELTFGGKKHVLYQHSYLGYGLMQARKSVHRLVEFVSTFYPDQGRGDGHSAQEVANPCLAKGTTRTVELDAVRPGEQLRNVTMVGKDVGSYEGCKRTIELVMAKDAVCQAKPCSFNGVYQPSILETFPSGKIMLLSYFYDRVEPFFPYIDTEAGITISTIGSLAQQVCMGRREWEKQWGQDTHLMAELDDRPEWCLDLTFMHVLLRLGYDFGEERSVRLEKQVDGTELGWCLGATLAIVGGELTCRV